MAKEKKDKKPIYKRWWFWVIIVVIGIGALGSGDEKPTSGGTAEKKEEVKEEKTEFKLGEIISYKDFDLVFDNKREVKDYGDNPLTVFDVSITSKKDNYQFFGDIQGVTEDNEVIDNTIAVTKEDLGDPITTSWTKTLNKGQKANGYLAFDKEINKIEVRSNVFKDDVITIKLD